MRRPGKFFLLFGFLGLLLNANWFSFAQPNDHSHRQIQQKEETSPENLSKMHKDEHQHSSEMEYFYQEYNAEPWRKSQTIFSLKSRLFRLGGIVVLLWAGLKVLAFLKNRRLAEP